MAKPVGTAKFVAKAYAVVQRASWLVVANVSTSQTTKIIAVLVLKHVINHKFVGWEVACVPKVSNFVAINASSPKVTQIIAVVATRNASQAKSVQEAHVL